MNPTLLADFEQRARFAPDEVYRHQACGWRYIPVHPFADEAALLVQLGWQAAQCTAVDALWACGDEVLMLQVSTQAAAAQPVQHVQMQPDPQGHRYLISIVDAPCLTRPLFEAVMQDWAQRLSTPT
ncbi:hypothetical protein [Leeia aquatica]|uniref:Uncharacterized protein n=1 Tax=Leeia aquatica TaxID=2725557 RepID=A0A847SAZ9_9NEIS|nr:hypothetical protein [Leeia aquatica]NLR74258.1 hypothetical protein [Leeia aquatica]